MEEVTISESSWVKTERTSHIPLLMLLSLLGLWAIVVYQIGGQWSVYEQYAYGWAVPVLCAFLGWRAWKTCPAFGTRASLSSLGGEDQGEGKRHDVIATSIIVIAAILLLPTRVIVEANPIWRAASYAIALEAIALSLASVYLAGGRAWLRQFAFPICFFLVSIPWPSALEGMVIQFLTRLNTGATVELLGFFGIPALQHGNVIEISAGMVGIDEACSGVRSVQTTLMMTLFFGALHQLSLGRRLALLAGGLLLALFCNLGRTFFLSWIAFREGISAIDRWHDPAGVAILVSCFLGIWGLAEFLKKQQREKGKTDITPSAELAFDSADAPQAAPKIRTAALLKRVTYGLLIWLAITVVATEGWFRLHEQKAASSANWSVKWPAEKDAFREIAIADPIRAQLRCSEGAHYAWRGEDGTSWQSFYFQWFPARTLKERVTVHLAKTHRPEHCLTAAGKVLEQETEPRVLRVGGLELPYRGLVFDDRGNKLHVFFIAWEEGTPEGVYANMRSDSASRFAAAWSGTRGKGQRVMEVAAWGHPDLASAEIAFKNLMQQMITVQNVDIQNSRGFHADLDQKTGKKR